MNLVNMYAQAEAEEKNQRPLLPTGNILPGPLPERAIADGVQGEGVDDLGPDVEKFEVRQWVSFRYLGS